MPDTTQVEQPKPEWGGFDERARNTMYAAREEARARNHVHVGTQDMLAALLLDPDCVARRSLADLGVDVGALLERARTIVPPGSAPIAGDPVLSPRAKEALTLAVGEARRLEDKCITTGHLLVGLLSASDGMGYSALTDAGVTLDDARAAIQGHSSAE